jgi:hypothetical protein
LTEEQIVKQACENILCFITTGDENHTLRREDEVLLLGDHKDLSPLYTETLAETIREWQGTTGKVHVKFLPKERPMKDANQMDPEITKLAQTVPVAIGTYSNYGIEIRQKEKGILFERFVNRLTDRTDNTLRLYVVAARTTKSILDIYANSELIQKTNELTKKVQKYLQEHSLEMMYVYTPNESECKEPLRFRIPLEDKIKADFFGVQERILNLPSGEDFFEPKPKTAFGTLTFVNGSYYDLQVPVNGRIEVIFKNGRVINYKDIDGKDSKILGYLNRDLKVLANRHFAEMGIGTFAGSTEIPWEDMLYNEIILEKKKGFHWAYGGSTLVGGTHKAPVHVDNGFTYGDVYIGNQLFMHNGQILESVL